MIQVTLNIKNLLNFFVVNGKLAKQIETLRKQKKKSDSSAFIPKRSNREKS